MVNKLTSAKTQLPYGYYHWAFCEPEGGAKPAVTEILGSRCRATSLRRLPTRSICWNRSPASCFASRRPWKKKRRTDFATWLRTSIWWIWIVDNLPATKISSDRFWWQVHQWDPGGLTAVSGFEVEPRSTTPKDGAPDCSNQPTPFDLDKFDEVMFSYTVSWKRSDVRWASRWDTNLKVQGQGQIHWFAILNFCELCTEISPPTIRCPQMRKPRKRHSTFLSVMAGSGMQLLGMSVVTLIFTLLGFLSPAQRGSLLEPMMLGGYTAARLCKVFDGDEGRWKTRTMFVSLHVSRSLIWHLLPLELVHCNPPSLSIGPW